jgi:hypothetical protein
MAPSLRSASSDAEIAFMTQVFDGCERPGFSVHTVAGGVGHVETNSAAV